MKKSTINSVNRSKMVDSSSSRINGSKRIKNPLKAKKSKKLARFKNLTIKSKIIKSFFRTAFFITKAKLAFT